LIFDADAARDYAASHDYFFFFIYFFFFFAYADYIAAAITMP